MFFKTASISILDVYNNLGFNKRAQKNQDDQVKRALNLLSKERVKAIASVYDLSDNIDDYIFPIARAVTADVPNSNADCFTHGELTRFSTAHKCQVYSTFNSCPLHIEHASEDPKSARGFIVDSFYITDNPKDRHVITLIAIDTTKDQPLASGMISGQINKFSMGCICDSVQCSVSDCSKIAKSDKDLCGHLLYHKLAKIKGELVYEKCLGVEFQELSAVGDPADPTAITQVMLQKASRNTEIDTFKQNYNRYANLLSEKDRFEVARFLKSNLNKLPESVLRLFDKVL